MDFGLDNIDVSLIPLALCYPSFVNNSLSVTNFALIQFGFLKPHQAKLYKDKPTFVFILTLSNFCLRHIVGLHKVLGRLKPHFCQNDYHSCLSDNVVRNLRRVCTCAVKLWRYRQWLSTLHSLYALLDSCAVLECFKIKFLSEICSNSLQK